MCLQLPLTLVIKWRVWVPDTRSKGRYTAQIIIRCRGEAKMMWKGTRIVRRNREETLVLSPRTSADKPTRKIPAHLIRPVSASRRQAEQARAFSARQPQHHRTPDHPSPARPSPPTNSSKMSVSSFGHHGKTPAAVVSVPLQLDAREAMTKERANTWNRACAARTRLIGVLSVLSMYPPISNWV
jgi:hypothetical protein